MPPDESFAELMARLRAGDPDAAERVFRRFARRLIALARGRLGAAVRQKVDPEDVMQSAYKSFFRRQAEGEFDLDGWDGLWGLLVCITLRKCGHQVERYRAGCRDVRREAAEGALAGSSAESWAGLAREPTPPEAALLAEAVEGLMRGLAGRERDVAALALQGYAPAEISAELNRPRRTVYNVLARVKKRLEEMRDAGPPAP